MAYSVLVMLVFATLMSLSSARAVNISNTWMLPEEGFPVFYRYFRDRISWYEADAVCQFHHANLVTADSSSQYDAIRAYLKELDITESVWIGLSKAPDKPNFTWTNFRSLNGEGHWQEAIPKATDQIICVTMDPAADFLWKAMPCGGPEIASFICELSIPPWALGPRGCLLTELPSLTVLYIPEQSAVELTSDCGLDGTKRIACKGNADREEILKQLTCAISQDDFDEKSTKSPIASSTMYETSSDENSFNGKTTKNWIWTSNTIDIDYGMPTRHRRETEDTISPLSTKSTTGLSSTKGSYEKKLVTSEDFITPTMNYYETEVTTNIFENDSTLDSSVSKADQSVAMSGIGRDLTTQRLHPDEQTEMMTNPWIRIPDSESTESLPTTDSKISVTAIEETVAEYPNAINQGQLFSIIENGTMFDIIELNDSNSSGIPKTQQNIKVSNKNNKVSSLKNVQKDVTTQPSYAIVNNSKQENIYGKSEGKPGKSAIAKKSKVLAKDKFELEDKHAKGDVTKEVELYPIIKDTSIKLNRTFRKELPPTLYDSDPVNDGNKFEKSILINLSVNNHLADKESEPIEIELQEGGENTGKNISQTPFIADSKKRHFEKSGLEIIKPNISKDTYLFDGHIVVNNDLPNEMNINVDLSNNGSEITENTTLVGITSQNPEPVQELKKQLLPKSLLTEPYTTDVDVKSVESGIPLNPLEAEPEGQPRPNRQRQLTRPQRRSFYPYFFSRVLG